MTDETPDEKTDNERPEHRDNRVAVRLDDETLELAKQRLKKENDGRKHRNQKPRTLSNVIRSFLFFWSREETPANWTPPDAPDENKRAAKRPTEKPPEKPKRKRK